MASDPCNYPTHETSDLLNDGDLAHIYAGDAEVYRLDGGTGQLNIQMLEEEWGTGEVDTVLISCSKRFMS